MSENILQIYTANPATVIQATDLFYLGRSPYATGNDMACTYSTLIQGIPSVTWINVTASPQALAINTGYIVQEAGNTSLTLPTVAPVGSIIEIANNSLNTWTLNQNAGQHVIFLSSVSTIGTGGSVVSLQNGTYLKLLT